MASSGGETGSQQLGYHRGPMSLARFVNCFYAVVWLWKYHKSLHCWPLASPLCIFEMDELRIERATWGYWTVIIKHTSSLCCQGNIWLVFIQIAQHVGQGLPVRLLWCTLLVHLSKHASCKKSWLASIPARSLLLLPSSPCSSVL